MKRAVFLLIVCVLVAASCSLTPAAKEEAGGDSAGNPGNAAGQAEAPDTAGQTATKGGIEGPDANPSPDPNPDRGDSQEFETDDESYLKVADLIHSVGGGDAKFRHETDGFVKKVALDPDGIATLTVDPAEFGGADPQNMVKNDSTETIDITISDYPLILTDPHNHFTAISVKGFSDYVTKLNETSDGVPIAFYSKNGEVSTLVEIMLP
jgi:hypothetical protein